MHSFLNSSIKHSIGKPLVSQMSHLILYSGARRVTMMKPTLTLSRIRTLP